MMPLGRLEKVDLRTVWLGEASDFTPWLAREENLKLLGDTIGIELEFSSIEKDVGLFRADILCKNTLDGSWVLIENQLERTDHNHLGQLLTYAAGLEAVTIIWIASRFTEEHRAALDWLNQITGERFNFFGLEIELWRIGESPLAPKFNVISKPNDWARNIQESARAASASEVSDHRQRQLEYWTAFKEFMEKNQSFIRCPKPKPLNSMTHSVGRTGFHLNSCVSSWNWEGERESEIRAEFCIDFDKGKEIFNFLELQKEAIEAEFGESLLWYNPPNARVCRIQIRRTADFLNSQKWDEQHEWLRVKLEKLQQIFAPRVKSLDVSQIITGEEINYE
jgi:hypothetical protein